MESIQTQLQEIKQTKLAKLIAVTNGEVVVIKIKNYLYKDCENLYLERKRTKFNSITI